MAVFAFIAFYRVTQKFWCHIQKVRHFLNTGAPGFVSVYNTMQKAQ